MAMMLRDYHDPRGRDVGPGSGVPRGQATFEAGSVGTIVPAPLQDGRCPVCGDRLKWRGQKSCDPTVRRARLRLKGSRG